jgi:hypothetical protein
MNTKLASAFGLAMLAVAFSFSSSFACPDALETTSSVLASVVSESGPNVTTFAEASAVEGQIGEIAAPASGISKIEAATTDASAADPILVEITETVTVVVPGQKLEVDEGVAIPASGIAKIETSFTYESSQTAAPESEAKATVELSAQTGMAGAQTEVAEPAPDVAAIEAPSTDVNAPPAIAFVDAVLVAITETVTIVVPGQKSEERDDVEITGPAPEHTSVAPNLKLDEANTALEE